MSARKPITVKENDIAVVESGPWQGNLVKVDRIRSDGMTRISRLSDGRKNGFFAWRLRKADQTKIEDPNIAFIAQNIRKE